VLAWIGSRDNEQLLVGIADALREVHRLTGARILLIGQQSGSLEGLEQLVDRVQWSEETQHHLLARADVGLMPLDDDPYSRGKCGYKLLQYAAAGLPAVGSPVGTNAGILKALGLPGATSDAEWRDHLLELLTLSTEQRRALGLHTLRAVEAHYSYEAWDSGWRAAVGLPPRSNDGWSSRGT
jgi:glycosyltransferase involved in cell wall biosynthesis